MYIENSSKLASISCRLIAFAIPEEMYPEDTVPDPAAPLALVVGVSPAPEPAPVNAALIVRPLYNPAFAVARQIIDERRVDRPASLLEAKSVSSPVAGIAQSRL